MSKKTTELTEIKDKLAHFKQLLDADGGRGFKDAQKSDDPVSSIIVKMSLVRTSELKEHYIL